MIVQYKPLVTTDWCNKCFLMLLTAFQNTTDKVFPFSILNSFLPIDILYLSFSKVILISVVFPHRHIFLTLITLT